jgi:hypothetical protein
MVIREIAAATIHETRIDSPAPWLEANVCRAPHQNPIDPPWVTAPEHRANVTRTQGLLQRGKLGPLRWHQVEVTAKNECTSSRDFPNSLRQLYQLTRTRETIRTRAPGIKMNIVDVNLNAGL